MTRGANNLELLQKINILVRNEEGTETFQLTSPQKAVFCTDLKNQDFSRYYQEGEVIVSVMVKNLDENV